LECILFFFTTGKKAGGVIDYMNWINRLKNDLNRFLLTQMDNNEVASEERDIIIKAGDIIEKYRG